MPGYRRLTLHTLRIAAAVLWLTSVHVLASTETRAYQPFLTFGQEGREVGLFRQPSSIIVDADGLLYIADTYNHRIQVFEPNGRFRRVFGSEGAQRGGLSRPKRLAWGPQGLLYVADTGNHRIQAFDAQGNAVSVLGGFGNMPAQFNGPEGIAVDAQGVLYVADTQNHRVQKFAPDGRFLGSWGGSGSGKGEFLEPADIVLDREERLLVADSRNHRVQIFTSDGRYLGEIGRAGKGEGEFDNPRGVAVDDQGHIYVVDTGNGRVQIFDRAGRYLAQVGHIGRRPLEFYYPGGVWLDLERTLYVADTINHRVQVLSYLPAYASLEQGWEALQAGRLGEALDKWGEALSFDPTLAEALYGSGMTYLRKGDTDLAIAQLKAALALQPDYPDARWALYRTYFGKLTLPLIGLGLVAALSSGSFVVRRLRRRVLRERARHFMEEGRMQETILTYERLLHLNRNDIEVCKVLENLYEHEGLESKRTQVNEIIVRLDPDNLHALSYLGKQQFADRRYTEAQQTWERVLQHDVTWAEGYFYLGAVLAERGERESALTAHQQALSRLIAAQEGLSEPQPYDSGNATDPSVTSAIALWDRELADRVPHEQALASFQEARHRLAQRYVTQGRESLQRDDAEGAIAYLRWVNALDPADEAARALLKQAQTSVTFERGLHHYQLQEYVEALRCFRETLALDPEHDKAKRYLRYAQQCLEGGLSERFRHLDLGEREKS